MSDGRLFHVDIIYRWLEYTRMYISDSDTSIGITSTDPTNGERGFPYGDVFGVTDRTGAGFPLYAPCRVRLTWVSDNFVELNEV